MMIRILSPYFVVGLEIVGNEYCYRAPPIVKYMEGWDIDEITHYCRRKGWEFEINQ